jgi:hypothetical protein
VRTSFDRLKLCSLAAEPSFDALSELLPFGWFEIEYYDTIYPFEDDRS